MADLLERTPHLADDFARLMAPTDASAEFDRNIREAREVAAHVQYRCALISILKWAEGEMKSFNDGESRLATIRTIAAEALGL